MFAVQRFTEEEVPSDNHDETELVQQTAPKPNKFTQFLANQKASKRRKSVSGDDPRAAKKSKLVATTETTTATTNSVTSAEFQHAQDQAQQSTQASEETSVAKSKAQNSSVPVWMRAAHTIPTGDEQHECPVRSLRLHEGICSALESQLSISTFFATQASVIPAVLRCGAQGRDVMVMAPTGSGKTLAYVVPVCQSLSDRVVRRLRALVILPTRDLVAQVNTVFQTIAKPLGLQVGTAVGETSFQAEQNALVHIPDDGLAQSKVDILLCTPGRLMDHLDTTEGFTLEHLRFLVVDEADRLLKQSYQDWIRKVFHAATQSQRHGSVHQTRNGDSLIDAACERDSFDGCGGPRRMVPFQKLLFSATLTKNPKHLAALKLKNPIFFTASATKQYSIPAGLSEYLCVCRDGEKPLMLVHLVETLKSRQTIVFTSSVDTTHRLFRLLECIAGLSCAEFSSSLPQSRRTDVLNRFRSGSLSLIVCSDAMARGMDLEHVDCVVNYDVPPFIRTYIHRVGRTARAKRKGQAYTLAFRREIRHLKEMLRLADGSNLVTKQVKREDLDDKVDDYEALLEKLEVIMAKERDGKQDPQQPAGVKPSHKSKSRKLHKNSSS